MQSRLPKEAGGVSGMCCVDDAVWVFIVLLGFFAGYVVGFNAGGRE